MTPRQAIKQKCLECSVGNSYEARICELKNCPLWQFREQEKNKPKRQPTQKQLEVLKKRQFKKSTTQ